MTTEQLAALEAGAKAGKLGTYEEACKTVLALIAEARAAARYREAWAEFVPGAESREERCDGHGCAHVEAMEALVSRMAQI